VSLVTWKLASPCSAQAKFEVQRAGSNRSFTTIGTVGGSGINLIYNYADNELKAAVNYYRLKMIDADGTVTYSRIVAIMNGTDGLLLTSLVPTVVTHTAMLTIASSSAQKVDLLITDMLGRLVKKQNYAINAGNTSILISAEGLGAGVYQLVGVSAERKTNVIRFVRQ